MPSVIDTAPPRQLRAVRARGHRSFLAPKFGVQITPDGAPEGLTLAQLTTNPKLGELGLVVFEQLQRQMSGAPAGAGRESAAARRESAEAAAYRARLELWADLLEIFLEETLAEIERLDAGGGPA